MQPFEDKAGAVDERSTERMNFRTKPRIKAAIQRAAALAGVDDSVFTINAAYRAAMDTIATHERTILQKGDVEAFFDALDNPPPITAALRAAIDRHHRTISSQ